MKRKSSEGISLKSGEYEKKTGGYIYRWTDSIGNRHSVGAKTLNELRKKELLVHEEIAKGVSRSSNTLYEQIRLYLSTKITLAPSTIANYEHYLEGVIKDSFIGKIRIADLKSSDVLRFYAEMVSVKGYSIGTVKIIHKLIHPALDMAVKDRLLYNNVSDGCTRDYNEESEKKYALTQAEKDEFLRRVSERAPLYLTFVKFLFASGVRLSEGIGLTWDDVYEEGKTGYIDINHQILYRDIRGKATRYASKTKTEAGSRKIPITPEIKNILEEQRKMSIDIKRPKDYSIDGYSNFIFVSSQGTCLSHNAVQSMMRRISKNTKKDKIAIRNVSPHICRHTYITEMAMKGCDMKVLQALVGQKDFRVTYNVYNHLDDNRVASELERLGIMPANKGTGRGIV